MLNRWNEKLKHYPGVAGALLLFATFAAYAGALANQFVYDDGPQILENPFVLNPHLWSRIFTGSVWSFRGVAVGDNFYRPLQVFVYWLLYRWAGPNPAAFHAIQLLLYAASVWLVYRLGQELLENDLAAFLGALLWTLHPLHVEAVAWISGIPEVGFAFFYLLAFLLFLRTEAAQAGRVLGHGLAVLAFFPALFFKEMALSFPLLLVAYWFFLGPRTAAESWPRRMVRWIPYLGAVGVYAAIRWTVLGYFSHASSLWKVSPRLLGASVGLLGEHTRLFFWPTHLNVFRTFDLGMGLRSPWTWLTLLVLFLSLLIRKREPLLGFLVVWWAIALIPCLDIRQLSFPLLAERFSYLASVGLCLAISFALIIRLPERVPSLRPVRLALPVMALVMCFWAVQTVRAIPNWRNNGTLTDYSLQQSPNAPLLHSVRGVVLEYTSNDLEGAKREFETALQLNQNSLRPMQGVVYEAYLGLGQIAQRRGRTEEALRYYHKAVRVLPHLSTGYDALGAVYFPSGQYGESAGYFAQAVKVNPQDLGARFYLGTCWMKLGRYRDAAEQFRAAREIDPNYTQAYEAETRALEAEGDAAGAAQVRTLLRDR